MGDFVESLNRVGWGQVSSWNGECCDSLNTRYPEIFNAHPLGRTSCILRPLGSTEAKRGYDVLLHRTGRTTPTHR